MHFCLFLGLEIVSLLLGNNQITHIPDDSFSGLDFSGTVYDSPKLDLSQNNLQSIDRHAFRGIRGRLEEIYIRYCSLSEFPIEGLRDVRTLNHISIAENYITDIPDSTFREFPDLAWLVFDRNTFSNVNREGLLSGVESILTLISLEDTSLTTFPSKLIRNLRKIEYVVLSENDIKTLPADIFKGFQNTTPIRLFLGGNNINCISQHFLRGTSIQLQKLDLSRNQLTSLDFVDPCLPAFQYNWNNDPPLINIEGNPLDCYCDLLNLVIQKTVEIYATCEQPPPYHDMTLNASLLQSYHETGEFRCPVMDPVVCPSGCDRLMTSSLFTVAYVTYHMYVTVEWMHV